MRAKMWPNGLGVDVGQHEVWFRLDGTLGVRAFYRGEPSRWAIHLPGSSPVAAALWTARNGKAVEN